MSKTRSLFDHLSGITHEKVSWDKLTDADRKSFSSYMINRWLSMNQSYIELVNELQKYTVGLLENREVYNLYLDVLPKQKSFNKYIKGKKSSKYNTELIDLLSNHFVISRKEVTEYLDMSLDSSRDTIVKIIKKYGKTDRDVEKLLKTEKPD